MTCKPGSMQLESKLTVECLRSASVVAGGLMQAFSLVAQRLCAALGLPLMVDEQPCHGYQNACVCSECKDRDEIMRQPRRNVRQPWEKAA
jgi:hypothetical protein